MKSRKGRGADLVIDDNAMVLKTSTLLLKALGYTVFCAVSGEDALECYADKLDGIDLAIIDMVMPGMDGGQCHARIRRLNPEIKTICAAATPWTKTSRRSWIRAVMRFYPNLLP